MDKIKYISDDPALSGDSLKAAFAISLSICNFVVTIKISPSKQLSKSLRGRISVLL